MPRPREMNGFSAPTIWADDPSTGRRRDLGMEEDLAFWAWATVEVLRASRVRSAPGAIPVISAYDRREYVWLAPSPWLYQRRPGTEHRRICEGAIRNMLNAALVPPA